MVPQEVVMNIEAEMMHVEQQEVWKGQSEALPAEEKPSPRDDERGSVPSFGPDEDDELEEGELPREECERSREECELPREEGELLREECELPREEGDLSREECELPREEGDLSREEGQPSREECELPREEGELPREECKPSREGCEPREEGELSPVELPRSTTSDGVEGPSANRVEITPYEFPVDQVEIVISNIIDRHFTFAPAPSALLQGEAEDNSSSPNVGVTGDVSDLPSVSNAPPAEDLPAMAPSPGKKKAKKGKPSKKHGGKHKPEKELEDLQLEASQLSIDAEVPREQQEPTNAHPADLEPKPSDVAQRSAPEGEVAELKSPSEVTDQGQQESQSTSLGLGENFVEEKLPAAEPLLLHSKSGRSLGRWADVAEDTDSRAVDAEAERSRTEDMRADVRNSHKEQQEIRGKSQQSSREAVSPASRELNWRRKPADPRPLRHEQQPRSDGKFDVDLRRNDHQDFRSRVQHGAEPQATHKNWVPRRGLQRFDGEGRADQNRNRGKGKQGREAGPQVQSTKDFTRQKFEADLKVKQEELLQKSKQTLRAEFQKAKRIEQAKKGKDELEMELEKNLVYESGELFYLNPL